MKVQFLIKGKLLFFDVLVRLFDLKVLNSFLVNLLEFTLFLHNWGNVHNFNRQLVPVDLTAVVVSFLVRLNTILGVPFRLVMLVEEHLVFHVA